ncbi:hypothetical protein [Parabacteroides distasonis]|uniref:hypothetical protein n=1 Tax=Parabacteroides distasonis TaxID=823 RepID=UPI0034A58B92
MVLVVLSIGSLFILLFYAYQLLQELCKEKSRYILRVLGCSSDQFALCAYQELHLLPRNPVNSQDGKKLYAHRLLHFGEGSHHQQKPQGEGGFGKSG